MMNNEGARTMDEEASDNNQPPFDPSLPPLDERVIAVVRAAPSHTLRPARLSSELGISVEDATAELCGLLRAVGGGEGGASFIFEEVGDGGEDVDGGTKSTTATLAKTATTMTFTFPPNFEARARRYKRSNDAKQTILSALDVAARALKVFVAFGLIISLAVLSVASIMAMVAALVALARGGGDGRHRSELMRKIRSLIFTLRQMLWCYAVFGPGLDSGHDPFLRQTAGDLWLVLSMFCGNPLSFGFWWRANMLNRRRMRWGQGWGSRHFTYDAASIVSDDEVVHLVSRGEWGQQLHSGTTGTNTVATMSADQEGYRGLLSVVVEFLFGPSSFSPGPTESERWKLRGAVIIDLSSKASRRGVSLEELAPYSDNPPASLEDISLVVSEGLRVVSHFNGVPVLEGDATTCSRSTTNGKARFLFPELMAEASTTTSTTVNSFSHLYPDLSPSTWEHMLYAKDSPFALGGNASDDQRLSLRDGLNACPDQLYEKYFVLTKLQSKQFGQCCLLGLLNFIGIFWLRQSIGRDGLLEISNRALYTTADGILAVLYFYAKLFFALPLARLVVFVVCYNYCFVRRRNERRAGVAGELC